MTAMSELADRQQVNVPLRTEWNGDMTLASLRVSETFVHPAAHRGTRTHRVAHVRNMRMRNTSGCLAARVKF